MAAAQAAVGQTETHREFPADSERNREEEPEGRFA
jgi:hypothetical protein